MSKEYDRVFKLGDTISALKKIPKDQRNEYIMNIIMTIFANLPDSNVAEQIGLLERLKYKLHKLMDK